MAVVCMLCKMLCVIFLLISSLSSAYSLPDFHLYDADAVQDDNTVYYSYNLLQNLHPHVVAKREVEESGGAVTASTTSTATPNITGTLVAPVLDTEPAAKPTNDTVKTAVVVANKPNDSKISLNKNLGVNGTGIRKNVTREAVGTTATTLNNKAATPIAVPTESADTTTANETVSGANNQTGQVEEDDLDFPGLTDEQYNKTLMENNITKTSYDHHQFYNSTLTINSDMGREHWVEMANRSDVKISDLLSQSHRRATTVRLSFDFPFYGHIVRNITIATGGFLYTGEYVHSWLAATQYIAPLMANFDTSLSNDSYIKYVDNGTSFTVQWEKVALQDKPQDGNFTFQTTLHKNGDIVFVYKSIPMTIEDIQDDHHPVKVGLSDAYISDRTIFFVRRKTIYEYHRVNFNHGDVKNWTVIYLSALPTCLSNKDCVSCVSKPTSGFQCSWCPGTNRCSSGMDRNRQGWLSRGCDRKKITNESMCLTATNVDSGDGGADVTNDTSAGDSAVVHYDTAASDGGGGGGDHGARSPFDEPRQEPRITHSHAAPVSMGVSGILSIMLLVSLVLGVGVWIMYAYRNPHSISGQILIRYRPSQWSWKRGEARYTAATIHM